MSDRTGPREAVPIYIPALLIAASTVSILSTDIYTPSLPHLQAVFGTSAETVQLTVSLNLVGFGLGQLIYGPLADRFGRRPVLFAGMLGFALASIACFLAQTIGQLILARALLGATACAEAVVGYAVIRDLYSEKRAVRILGIYGMAIALAPAVGPVLGGYMHVWFGWRSNFALLTGLVAIVSLLIWRFLPETLGAADHGALRPARLLGGYLSLLRDGPFMAYALAAAMGMAALFAIVAAFPFVLIEAMGVATEHYGYYYAAIVVSFFLGSLVVTQITERVSSDQILATGLALCLFGGLTTAYLVLAGAAGPLRLTLTQCLFGFGIGLVFPAAAARAFAVCRTGFGMAAALFGSLEMAGASLGAFLIGALHDGTAWPIAVVISATSIAAIVIYTWFRPWNVALAEP